MTVNTNIEVLQIGSVVAVFMQMMISLFPRSRLCCILLTATLCASGQTTDSPSFADDTSSPSTDSRATGRPTAPPSGIPSDLPSFAPSFTPTSEPSLDIESSAVERFRQQFSVENGGFFSQSEAILFQGLYATYTEVFASEEATVDGRVSTSCEVLSQKAVNRRLAVASRTHHGARVRRTQDEWIIEVDFNMEYTSLYLNVTTYPTQFQLHINSNLDRIPEQMQLLGLNVSEAFIASRIVIRPDPTPLPTSAPTIAPTKSASPSTISSHQPSLAPSSEDLPATESPSASPTPQHQGPSQKKGSDVILISVSVVLAAIIMILGGVVYQKKKSDRYQNNQVSALVQGSLPNHSADLPNRQQTVGTMSEPDQDHVGLLRAVASPSIPSNQSLLSIGISRGGDSVDEVDTTQDLADEFDEYKDQNLEKMRAGVEGNLMGFDGMMSQALTRALIDDDETNFDATELLWGGSRHLTGIEVEASALGEVADWLKRNETPADDERRLFMQETLNKMVSSVRHGFLGPEEASRSIHECAALLGLQLAAEIPVTTLIITGMRKTVTAEDMLEAFAEFGEISEAAVASNQRGFGILRFISNQSVDRAMSHFRTEEIVVQDVAVQVKVLRPGGNNALPEDDALSFGFMDGLS